MSLLTGFQIFLLFTILKIAGAVVISVTLLAASIVTDFSARRWLKAH